MASDEQQKRESPANVVGFNAKALCNPESVLERGKRYPLAWKECCREIYIAYQQVLSEKLGAEVKWRRIRNIIMRDFDTYDGKKLVEENEELSRQSLEHWINNGGDIGDGKFKFLDYYLHKSLIEELPEFIDAAERVMRYRETLQLDSLRTLYLGDRSKITSATVEAADAFTERLYVVDGPTNETENFRAAIYLMPPARGRYHVLCYYFDFEPQTTADILERGYPYFGYFLPLGIRQAPNGKTDIHGVIQLFDRGLLRTKGAVYHNTSNCALIGDGQFMKIAPLHCATHPFRPAINAKAETRPIKDIMTMTFLTLDTFIALKAVDLLKAHLSDDHLSYLNSLHDRYLLW
jgi:hypothetical protein